MTSKMRQYLKAERSKRMKRANYLDMMREKGYRRAENRRVKEAGTTTITNDVRSSRVVAIETVSDGTTF